MSFAEQKWTIDNIKKVVEESNSDYVKVGEATISGNTELEVVFDNIPQGFTNLIISGIVASNRTTENFDNLKCIFNDDTSASYDRQWWNATGGTNIGGGATNTGFNNDETSANVGQVSTLMFPNSVGSIDCTIFGYSRNFNFKNWMAHHSRGALRIAFDAGEYKKTAPITKIKLVLESNNTFREGSTISLYAWR